MPSKKNKSSNFNNSRWYSSCENNGIRKIRGKNHSKVNKFHKKIWKVAASNQISGRIGRDHHTYGTNRSSTRGQNHSMYCLSHIGNYVPLSANVRQSNPNNEFQNSLAHQERPRKKSQSGSRNRGEVIEEPNQRAIYRNNSKVPHHFNDSLIPVIHNSTMYK